MSKDQDNAHGIKPKPKKPPKPPDEKPILYGPDDKPLNLPEGVPVRAETRPRAWWRRRLAALIGVISFLGVLATFYSIRPKPTAIAAVSTPTADPYAMRFSLNNSGDLTMHTVDVSCDYTKLIFERENTLIIGDRFVASMYRVQDVGPGEGFVVKCPEPWRYFTSRDMSQAIFTLGDLLPEYNARSFYFAIRDDGGIEPINIPNNSKRRCGECVMHPVSDLDLTIIIKYSTIIPWITSMRSLRFIGSQGSDGIIAWQTVPVSQGPIKDSLSGPIFKLEGGQMFATNDVSARPFPPQPR